MRYYRMRFPAGGYVLPLPRNKGRFTPTVLVQKPHIYKARWSDSMWICDGSGGTGAGHSRAAAFRKWVAGMQRFGNVRVIIL